MGESPADDSGAPTDPLSLVGAILQGGTGSTTPPPDAPAGSASPDAAVSTSSEPASSSDAPASADGSVSTTGTVGAAPRGPLSKTVGHVLGAVTGAP